MRNRLSILVLLTLSITTMILIDDDWIVDGQRVSNQQQQRRRPSGNRRPNRPKQRGKNRGGKPSGDDIGIYCYTCYADFERVPLTVFNPVTYIYNNPCYNPALNYTLTDNEYLTKCSSTTKYCMVDVTRMNGVLISVDRRCGQSTCRKTCLSRGYGVIRETCTFCCGGRINEDHPDYDEEIHSVYKCPNEPH